jgi:tetratricopeptide (TPR) repeat protein
MTNQDMSARVGAIGGTIGLKGQGAAPAGTRVELLRNDRSPFATVFTDAAGSFEFRGVPPGNYFIVIESPNYQRVDISVEVQRGGMQRRTIFLEPRSGDSTAGGAVLSAGAFSIPAEARKLFSKGESQLRKGHYPEAGKCFDRALAIEPRFAEALSGRGLIFLQQDDPEHAQELFERAIAMRPDLAQALFGLGSVCSRLKNYEAAVAYFTRGLSIDPGSYVALFERARCLFELRRFEPAERDCIRARQVAPEPKPALNVLLGNIYLGEGRKSEALREFEEFLRLDARNPIAPEVRSMIRKLRDAGVRPAP